MTAEKFVGLIEEFIDLKVQQRLNYNAGSRPDLAKLLHQKRDLDHHRLAELRAHLIKTLETES